MATVYEVTRLPLTFIHDEAPGPAVVALVTSRGAAEAVARLMGEILMVVPREAAERKRKCYLCDPDPFPLFIVPAFELLDDRKMLIYLGGI